MVCWQFLHSAPHRQLWGGEGPVLPAPALPPPTLPTVRATLPQPVIAPLTQPHVPRGIIRLGDKIKTALSAVGITEERASAWLGQPCGCKQRQEKFNQLSDAAEEALKSSKDKALSLFKRLLGG